MTKRAALVAIFICMLAIAGAYATAFLPHGAPPAAAWVIATATAGVMAATLVLGAARGRGVQHRGLRILFAAIFLVLAIGFGAALRTGAITGQSKLWLGLPAGAAIILYIVGLLPMLVLPLAYALTFEKTTLSDDELNEIRRKLQELKHEPSHERQRAGAHR